MPHFSKINFHIYAKNYYNEIIMLKFLLLLFLISTSLIGNSFIIGRDPNWNSTDLSQRQAQVNAFLNELVQEISTMSKRSIQIQDGNADYLQNGMKEGCLQGIFTIVDPKTANKKRFDFSSPLIFLGPVIVVQTNSQDNSLSDLEGKNVGINSYDQTVLIAQKVRGIVIKNYDNLHFALNDLIEGKLDAVLMPTLQAQALIPQRYPLKLKISSEPLSDEAIRLIVPKGRQSELLTIFNKGVKETKKSGLFKWLKREFSVY